MGRWASVVNTLVHHSDTPSGGGLVSSGVLATDGSEPRLCPGVTLAEGSCLLQGALTHGAARGIK